MYRKTMQSGESRWRNRPMQSGSSTTVPHLPGRSHVASLRRFRAGIYVRSSTCRSRSSPSLVLFHSFSSTHPFLSSHPFRLRFNLLSSFSVFPLFTPFHSLCTSCVPFFPSPFPPSFLFCFFHSPFDSAVSLSAFSSQFVVMKSVRVASRLAKTSDRRQAGRSAAGYNAVALDEIKRRSNCFAL